LISKQKKSLTANFSNVCQKIPEMTLPEPGKSGLEKIAFMCAQEFFSRYGYRKI
jgi:hypothetical protein